VFNIKRFYCSEIEYWEVSSFCNIYRKVLVFGMIASIINLNFGTPLDDYVNEPDPTFNWKLIQTYPSSTYALYILNMTSQKWFDVKIKEI